MQWEKKRTVTTLGRQPHLRPAAIAVLSRETWNIWEKLHRGGKIQRWGEEQCQEEPRHTFDHDTLLRAFLGFLLSSG